MKALVWTAPSTMEIQQRDIPVIKPEEVLIQVEAVGICGSEIEGFLGHNSLRKPPLIMGHEFCGRIVELGENVSHCEIGNKVVVNPLISCGVCDRCRRGTENLCDSRAIIGIHRSGSFAEYVAVPASSVHTVPESISAYRAALAEPLACCLRAARRAAALHPFANVLIYGAGAIGLLSGLVSKILGANKVIMLDLNDERLATAQAAGIEFAVNSNNQDVPARVKEITADKGIDVIIDAAGFLPTRTQAFELVNPDGVIMNIGLGIDETPLRINHLIRSEITVLGSFCYTKQDFHDALELLIAGKISEEGWSEIRSIEEGQLAFHELVAGQVGKSKIFLNI
ncbi:alcohol dehydrogenase catalytic domain-containing protein [Aneurinibacillus sp. Ricciae_BoGa-3]|uniref:zinc-dependent alcohol dehydrogenase n=1 Tax=Aneurinibacillus sp. Ricciae_BoGa-3 TaxID=3022697 RepID=UPI00233F96DF|nr:alcohol dehydrogenase catalytic domain-containing protein [Aneurinibacillus sp. Ricciae_BoGa-3]WCK53228.1 alcohol dehydrogenase catalytic domain-containing protein [Aneurinibacillus sp. Ricciae_BoGa-3]